MTTIGQGAVVGRQNQTVVPVTANYTVGTGDDLVQVTTGTSPVTVTFPAPTPNGSFNPATQRPDQSTVGQYGNAGQRVTVQKIDTGAGTVICAGTFNIGTVYGLASRWSQAVFESDGTRWNLMGTVS